MLILVRWLGHNFSFLGYIVPLCKFLSFVVTDDDVGFNVLGCGAELLLY